MKKLSLFAIAALLLHAQHSFCAEPEMDIVESPSVLPLKKGRITIIKWSRHTDLPWEIYMPVEPDKKGKFLGEVWGKHNQLIEALKEKMIACGPSSSPWGWSVDWSGDSTHYRAPSVLVPWLSRRIFITHEGLINSNELRHLHMSFDDIIEKIIAEVTIARWRNGFNHKVDCDAFIDSPLTYSKGRTLGYWR